VGRSRTWVTDQSLTMSRWHDGQSRGVQPRWEDLAVVDDFEVPLFDTQTFQRIGETLPYDDARSLATALTGEASRSAAQTTFTSSTPGRASVWPGPRHSPRRRPHREAPPRARRGGRYRSVHPRVQSGRRDARRLRLGGRGVPLGRRHRNSDRSDAHGRKPLDDARPVLRRTASPDDGGQGRGRSGTSTRSPGSSAPVRSPTGR